MVGNCKGGGHKGLEKTLKSAPKHLDISRDDREWLSKKEVIARTLS